MKAEMSRMKSAASRTVSSVIPIKAKNDAFLRVIMVLYAYRLYNHRMLQR